MYTLYMSEITLLHRLHESPLTAMQLRPSERLAADALTAKGLATWRFGKLTLTLTGRLRS